MAFGNGPRVVTDGLVLALDASDRNSYISGSSTWFDLTTNQYTASLINGPAFNSQNGGHADKIYALNLIEKENSTTVASGSADGVIKVWKGII